MGKIKNFQPLKLFIGVLLNPKISIEDLERLFIKHFGEIDFKTPPLNFTYTAYYEEEMGATLSKCFFSFKKLVMPEELPEIKILTNELEEQLLEKGHRQVNLDPGVISLHNLMLLTTKNFSHRIPLAKNIYAEVTLIWQKKGFIDLPWTYPDFKSTEYKIILTEIRTKYRQQL